MANSIQCPFCGTIWSSGSSGTRMCGTCKATIQWDRNGNLTKATPRR